MAKAQTDMIRDILGWPVSDEQRLAFIRQITSEKASPSPANTKSAPAKKRGTLKKATKTAHHP